MSFQHWCFTNFALLLTLLWITPLVHAVAFFPTVILLLVSCLLISLHPLFLYYFSIHSYTDNFFFFPVPVKRPKQAVVPLILCSVSSQCGKLGLHLAVAYPQQEFAIEILNGRIGIGSSDQVNLAR